MMTTKQTEHATDKKLAAVCGLFCEGCTLYIATMEDPARLKRLAGRFQLPEDVMKCYGCHSEKRGPYCQTCKMVKCAAEKGIEFCGDCVEYPCGDLQAFQAAMPHRIELWEDQQRIGEVGYAQWREEKMEEYVCPKCGTINSAYDLKCRSCGTAPSCAYVERHQQAIVDYLATIA